MALSTIEEAVDQLRRGGMVVVVDDEDRENEGDLIMAAEDVTPECDGLLPGVHLGRLLRAPREPRAPTSSTSP